MDRLDITHSMDSISGKHPNVRDRRFNGHTGDRITLEPLTQGMYTEQVDQPG